MATGVVGAAVSSVREATHDEPVWRERSNFILATAIESGNTDVTTEQLWGRKIDDRHFELCCIPFFAYDLALGDVVETDESYLVRRVSTRSGRYVFRVWFGESFHPRDEVASKLESLGALLEWSSPNLLAVDARDAAHAQQIADYLQEQEDATRLMYETGKTV
ncbi:MAG: DUF4265 domain-containing protein [Ferruginibacter sp.]